LTSIFQRKHPPGKSDAKDQLFGMLLSEIGDRN
jgi:hypothetical protein